MAADTKLFADGAYLVFRRKPSGKKANRTGLQRAFAGNPTFRHPDWDSAATEAERLLGLFPDSTFLIMREIGIVKKGQPDV